MTDEKMLEKYEKEMEYLEGMLCFERKLIDAGFPCIAGMDEVGRGPLAGPVVACALILPQGMKISGVRDSKKLSEKKRGMLSQVILEAALDYAIGEASPVMIDEINILKATHLAMQLAVSRLTVKPDAILVDGLNVPGIDLMQKSVIKGDARSQTIAAASIVAKVYRDELMLEYHKQYPEYDFIHNKGYGTAKHIEAIKTHGLSPIHRRSFTKKFTVSGT